MTGLSADLTRAEWRKSSYSGSNGGQCVEMAAVWRKSTRSGSNGGDCVETANLWRKSTRSSSNGGDCVEVQDRPRLIAVRDSKNPAGSKLLLTSAQWRAFTVRLQAG